MGERTCALCGEPTSGEASITVEETTRFYCHERPGWSCYMTAQANLVGACASVGIERGKSTAQMLREIGAP